MFQKFPVEVYVDFDLNILQIFEIKWNFFDDIEKQTFATV